MFLAALLAILVTMALALIRAFRGPSVYDRMLAANMFGTKTVLLIGGGGFAMGWARFVDVAFFFCMVNFVRHIRLMRFLVFSNSGKRTRMGLSIS